MAVVYQLVPDAHDPTGLCRVAIVFHLILPVVLIGLLARANLIWNQITAAMAICSLLAVIAIASFATYRNELAKLGLAIVVIVWMAFTNSDPYKMRFPGLDRYYHADKLVKPTSRIGSVDDDADKLVKPTSRIGSVDDDRATQEQQDELDELDQKLARKMREIAELDAVTTTRPRDNQAFNALGRAYFEAALLQEKLEASTPNVPPLESGFFRKAIEALMRLIPALAAGTTNFKEAKSLEASPAKVSDLPPTHAKTSNELYQNSIDAFTNSIRILPNEAFPYAWRAAALEKQLKKMVNESSCPRSSVSQPMSVGLILHWGPETSRTACPPRSTLTRSPHRRSRSVTITSWPKSSIPMTQAFVSSV